MVQIKVIEPFLSSISYLTIEAKRLKLHEVAAICKDAEKQLSKHVIDRVLATDLTLKNTKLSTKDYDILNELLTGASRMSQKQLKDFIRELERQETHLSLIKRVI